MSDQMSEGALITYAIDEIVKVFSGFYTLSDMTQAWDPGATLQKSGNVWWKPVQQQSNVQSGWELTTPDKIIELSIMGNLGVPNSTYRQLRADDLRDVTSYRRAVRADAMKLRSKVEADGLATAQLNGSFYVENSTTQETAGQSIWDLLGKANTKCIETEMYKEDGTCMFLNPTDYLAGGKDLITYVSNMRNGLPDGAYENGQIGAQVAGVGEVYQHSKTPIQPTSSFTSITVNATTDYAPEETTVVNGQPTNADNRFADLVIKGSAANMNAIVVGDKFTIADVNAISLDEKIDAGYLQTFTVIAKKTATATGTTSTITFSPRPVAFNNNGSLSALQLEYANVDESPTATKALVGLIGTGKKTNVFMVKDAMILATSPIPLNQELFQNLHAEQFQVGPINGIIGFEGNLANLTGSYRIAIWYAWQVEKPEAIGIAMTGQA